MRLESELKHLSKMLPPKQQAFDFACTKLWEQLPKADRQACCESLAKLLYQALKHSTQKSSGHER